MGSYQDVPGLRE